MFDFDATLPLMAVQFLLLTLLLNAIFYKPLTQAMDDRAAYIRTNETEARERLAKAQRLTQQYEQELAAARRQSQSSIESAQAEAKKIAEAKMAEAMQEAQVQREAAQSEIEEQKQAALRSLEQQVDGLSRQILEKLLGPALVK